MFLELLKREDTKKFLLDIVVTESRFSKKEIPNMICEEKVSLLEYDLLIGLDAIFKYSVIVCDSQYFKEFLDQLTKILKKVQGHNEIQSGVSRILINSCMQKLGIKSADSFEQKKRIVSYIYDKYIVHGYLFHSFPSVLLESVEQKGIFNNRFSFSDIQEKLSKYKLNVLTESKNISITDSPFMAFFYAYHSPYFMNELVTYMESDPSIFFRKDYLESIKSVNKLAKKADMFSSDRNSLIESFNEYWQKYDLDSSIPVVGMIKRSDFGRNYLREYPSLCDKLKEKDLESIVSNLLDIRYNHDYLENSISSFSVHVLKLPTLDFLKISRTRMGQIKSKEGSLKNDFVDQYGNVTILALVGVLFITLGVTITIIMLGGF